MITTRRRYLLNELKLAQRAGDDGAEALWRGRLNAVSGTPLPTTTPGYALLVAADYTCAEDVQGARVPELVGVGLTPADALIVQNTYPA